VLIDINDDRDVLVLAFPAKGATSRDVAEVIVAECLEAASFFEPAGVVVDLTRAAFTPYTVGAIVQLVVGGKRRGFRVAISGPEKLRGFLAGCKLTQYLAGVFDTTEEAVFALRGPPRAA
jgi:hypothetical protein